MPYIVYRPVPFFFEILFFKGEDANHAMDDLLHFDYSFFFPCPYLGRNVIGNFQSLLIPPFGNAQIKSGIIDAYEHIWFKLLDIFFTKTQVAKNGRQVFNYFPKTHEGELAIMLYQGSSGSFHQVATPATDNCIGFCFNQCFYQVAAM